MKISSALRALKQPCRLAEATNGRATRSQQALAISLLSLESWVTLQVRTMLTPEVLFSYSTALSQMSKTGSAAKTPPCLPSLSSSLPEVMTSGFLRAEAESFPATTQHSHPLTQQLKLSTGTIATTTSAVKISQLSWTPSSQRGLPTHATKLLSSPTVTE